MRKKRGMFWCSLGLAVLATFPVWTPLRAAPPETRPVLRIGILAKRGHSIAEQRWAPLARYLNRQIQNRRFEIVPLEYDAVVQAVKKEQIDFILTNPFLYVELESLYGVEKIVTLVDRGPRGEANRFFGGVIFTRSDRREINRLADLKGRSFMAVDQNSFGGWIMALRELRLEGILPSSFSRLEFGETHDAVVFAVRDGKVDAGTVRTGTLERMEAEGKIHRDEFYILKRDIASEFPYIHSTRLYPEWPLARLRSVSDVDAKSVSIALLEMPVDSDVAVQTGTKGWSVPLSYQAVHECMRELSLGAYRGYGQFSFGDILRSYWYWFLSLAILIIGLAILSLFILGLNRKLQAKQVEISALNADLGLRVSNRTMQIENLLIEEKYLSSILRTLADVNEILITAGSLAELLQETCNKLAHHSGYELALIALYEEGELRIAAHSHDKSNFLEGFVDGSIPRGYPSYMTFSEKRPILINEIITDTRAEFFRDVADAAYFSSVASFPLGGGRLPEIFGVLTVYSSIVTGFTTVEVSMLEELAGDIGFAIHSHRQEEGIRHLKDDLIRNYQETVLAFVNLIEKRDPYTAGHSRRVAYYCEVVARAMGYDHESVERLTRAAILHDIGKIVIPDTILLKPAELTPLEYRLIKQHVQVGFEMLSGMDIYKDLAEVMRNHHERFDGGGYPRGLKGDEIPELSRIMILADAFDTMTTERSYRPKRSLEEAIEELRRYAGTQFDPRVTQIAIPVLSTSVHVESALDQFPHSEVERERFAYFFKDQLTDLYNKSYLDFILQNGVNGRYPEYALIFNLIQFSAFNESHSWEHGNILLRSFADYLRETYRGSMVFRITGDDFVLLGEEPFEAIDKEKILEDSSLKAVGMSFEVHSRNVKGVHSSEELVQSTGSQE